MDDLDFKIKDTVYFSELADTSEFKKSCDKKLEAVLGRDTSGKTVTCDVSKMPHLLIAGVAGSGLSDCVNSVIMSILMRSTPDEVRLIMADTKQSELTPYNGIAHLLIPVITEPSKAVGALAWTVAEMERRYTLFVKNNVRNIDGFNELCKKKPEIEKIPYIVIFIAELADLMTAYPNDTEDSIVRLSQKARAVGIHLVIATQKPAPEVVTPYIKGNIISRIALMVECREDSRVILDKTGAEKLLGSGDMLYSPVGTIEPIRLRGCYVSPEDVERMALSVKDRFAAEYDGNIIAEIERQSESISRVRCL